jgi:hypothetical protein
VRYTTDGDLHIDNNVSERTLKLIGIGRKNWLFLGNDQAGQTAAIIYSFTGTCKHLGIDAFTYLHDVLTRLPTHPAERLEELLPHHWHSARQLAAAAPNAPVALTESAMPSEPAASSDLASPDEPALIVLPRPDATATS